MAETRKHGYHVAEKGHVELVGPSGASIMVKTAKGSVITEPVGSSLAHVMAELKEGESLASPADLHAAWANSSEVSGPRPPQPVIYDFVPAKKTEPVVVEPPVLKMPKSVEKK
jgi:hypothetical protein